MLSFAPGLTFYSWSFCKISE